MIETALVFDNEGNTIHWHEPPGRSGSYIPDTRDLWEIIWENRHRLGGVAHTHPWNGESWASGTDVTTFAAIEQGLGKRLLWPIATFTEVGYFQYNTETLQYEAINPGLVTYDIEDLDELVWRSR